MEMLLYILQLTECVPEEQCLLFENETVLTNEVLEPGFVKITNTSGCCPRTSKVCRPETCPPNPNCQKYYDLVVKDISSSCCPKFECGMYKINP